MAASSSSSDEEEEEEEDQEETEEELEDEMDVPVIQLANKESAGQGPAKKAKKVLQDDVELAAQIQIPMPIPKNFKSGEMVFNISGPRPC